MTSGGNRNPANADGTDTHCWEGRRRRIPTPSLAAYVGHQRNSALKREDTASVIIAGHALIQNLRRGHYELGLNSQSQHLRLGAAFDELGQAI